MEINVRVWKRDDLSQIRDLWLEYCRTGTRSDMHLRPNAKAELQHWLSARFRRPYSLGLAAEADGVVAGFLIGRIDEWESDPPLIEPRKIGIIDALYVADELRQQGIGRRLIDEAIEIMKTAHAVAVETVYDAWNDASAQTWHRAGFAPWMVHAYRIL
jgi:GNAT superfamily N-acetyltransferase